MRDEVTREQATPVQVGGDDADRLPTPSAQASADVVVNAVPLDEATRQQIERAYGVPIKPGRYWYDAATDVWGLEVGPTLGRRHLPAGRGRRERNHNANARMPTPAAAKLGP